MKANTFRVLLTIMVLVFAAGCISMMATEEVKLEMEGRYAEVADLIEKKIRNGEKLEWWDYGILCRSYEKLKQYRKLFDCLENRISKDSHQYLLSHAKVAIEFGQYDRAIEYAKKGYKYAIDEERRIAKKLNFSEKDMREVDVMFGQKMLSMSTLGIAYALNGNKEKANKIAAHIANYETDLTGESYKKSYLGQIYMAMGAYEGCLRIVSEPRYTDQFLKVVMTVSLDVAGANWIKYQEISIHFMKSKCLLETHNIKKAKSGYDRLLGFKHIKSSGSLYWQILADRGRICIIENEYEQEIKYLKQAVEVIEKYRASINTEATKIGFVGNKQEVYGNLVNILIKTGRYSEAFIYAERGKARALVDLLASKKYFGDRNKTDREGQKNMLIDLETYEMQSIVQDYRITHEERVHARGLIVSQKNNIRQADPQLASLVTVMPPNIAETQNLLSPEDTILEYFGFGDKLFVFVVSNEKVHGLKLESEGLKNDIEIFRSHIMDPKSDRFFEQSKILFEKLVRPIEGMLNSKNLTIVPTDLSTIYRLMH